MSRWIYLVSLLGFLHLACSEPPSENVGGETNWLRACVYDMDCPGGDRAQACLCGICTRACATDSCAPDELCVQPSSAASGALCQSSAPAPLCLPRCADNGCRAGYQCLDGACVPRAPVARLAFPGAEGFGARVFGGRGGRVVRVTTLAADGPGSLNEALQLQFPRTIVFTVSGVIAAPSFEIAEGNVTIAGQTAPGAGITLSGPLRGRYDEAVGNIVIRHLRLRPRYDGSEISQYDALQLSKNHHLMIDHVSAAYAVDETIDVLAAKDVTIQWSTIEAIDDQDNPTGRFIRGIVAGPNAARISVHHLLCTHNRGSCVSLAGGPAELVNTHFLDVRAAFTHSSPAQGAFSFVGNSFYSGPNTTLLPFVFDDESTSPSPDLAYYLRDNLLLNTTTDCDQGNVDNPWACSYDIGRGERYATPTAPRFESLAPDWVPIATTAAVDNETLLLPMVGALPRDRVTGQAVLDVRKRAGLLDATYPADLLEGLVVAEPPTDTDEDGMPDAWEAARNLDPRDASDQNALLETGYPAIDEYLNQLAAELITQGTE